MGAGRFGGLPPAAPVAFTAGIASRSLLKLILFVFPLGLDTLAASAAVGACGLTARTRLRVSLLMSSFEMAMPVVGLLLGRGLDRYVGQAADGLAIAVLILLGVWMIVAEGRDAPEQSGRLASGAGVG